MNLVHTCMEMNKASVLPMSHKNELTLLCAEPPYMQADQHVYMKVQHTKLST